MANLIGNAGFIEFASSGGLPRFDKTDGILGSFSWDKVLYFIPLILAGMVLAFIYNGFDKLTAFLSGKIEKYRIISCLIAGISMAVLGFLLSDTMFSGEHTLGVLIENYKSYNAVNLMLTSVAKLLLMCICIRFGWRGGSIFPIIFCGSAMAFGIALFIGNMECTFAAAVLVSAMYAFINRKTLMPVCILLLCFPITYTIPMLIAAFLSAKASSALHLAISGK